MIIQYTSKLQQFLGLKGNGIPLPEFTNPEACWHGNIFTLNRKKGLLLTHNETRYTIFIYGITKKDIDNLNSIIIEHLKYHLFEDKFTIKQMQYILAMSEGFSFFKSSNRKVLGSMTNMVDMIKVISNRMQSVNDKYLTKHINNTPFKVVDYLYPNKAFKEYIDEAIMNKETIKEIDRLFTPANSNIPPTKNQ